MSQADQDELQDIARSSYADMLNDVERNLAYQTAINLSVKTLVTSRKYNKDGVTHFKCCDIGTGSGLLSMMVVTAFKNLNYLNFHVTAFEAFGPMAECAEKVIRQNNMSDYITVVPSRSDRCEDKPEFDLLVAELLDTELIGEGCLEVYRHAVANLCSKDCLFVPKRARIFMEPIASAKLFARHHLDREIVLNNNTILELDLNEDVEKCNGIPAIDDMQASSLEPNHDFTRIVQSPLPVFEFDFSSLHGLTLNETKEINFHVVTEVKEPIVLAMWWDLMMYDEDNVIQSAETETKLDIKVLSCAPVWARDEHLLSRDKKVRELYGVNVWREHWIQGIYYLANVSQAKRIFDINSKRILRVYCSHDSFSLWFDLDPHELSGPLSCTCGVHRKFSRSQLAFLSSHCDTFRSLLEASCRDLNHQRLKGRIDFLDTDTSSEKEPADKDSKWKVYINTKDRVIRTIVDIGLTADCDIIWTPLLRRFIQGSEIDPIESFEIKCTPVKLEDLSRIRGPIRECCGYNLEALDELILTSATRADKSVESHFMCEYLSERSGEDKVIISSDELRNARNGSVSVDDFSLVVGGRQFCFICNDNGDNDNVNTSKKELDKLALIFWVECKLKNGRSITSGYLLNRHMRSQDQRSSLSSLSSSSSSSQAQFIQWSRDCKQVVHFLKGCPYKLTKQKASSPSSSMAKIATTTATTNNISLNKNNIPIQCIEYNVEIHITANDLAVYHRSKNENDY